MPEETVNMVRVRVTFPKQVWSRIEKLAEPLGMDAAMLVRVMASVQLLQWEMAYLQPRSLMVSEGEVEQRMDRGAEALFPDVKMK